MSLQAAPLSTLWLILDWVKHICLNKIRLLRATRRPDVHHLVNLLAVLDHRHPPAYQSTGLASRPSYTYSKRPALLLLLQQLPASICKRSSCHSSSNRTQQHQSALLPGVQLPARTTAAGTAHTPHWTQLSSVVWPLTCGVLLCLVGCAVCCALVAAGAGAARQQQRQQGRQTRQVLRGLQQHQRRPRRAFQEQGMVPLQLGLRSPLGAYHEGVTAAAWRAD